MSTPVWVAELADGFWARAGPPPPWPRDLRGAVARSLVGTVVSLPGLGVGRMLAWLAAAGVVPPALGADRPLRGGLFARDGLGVLFVNADDEPAEQRFSLAHELAHLLRDYLRPRERAVAVLGAAVLDVLDGRRPPAAAERLHAVLRGVPAGPFTHLLARDGGPDAAVHAAERAADRLACELLAPAAAVLALARGGNVAGALIDTFGLPPAVAALYARELDPTPREDCFLSRIRNICRPASNSLLDGGTDPAEETDA